MTDAVLVLGICFCIHPKKPSGPTSLAGQAPSVWTDLLKSNKEIPQTWGSEQRGLLIMERGIRLVIWNGWGLWVGGGHPDLSLKQLDTENHSVP